MAMTMPSRAFKAGNTAPRPAARHAARGAVVRASIRDQELSLTERLAPGLLAALVALSGASAIDAVYAPAARAEDEETMSPYQKRQLEMERRRELLREAREKAAARAAGVAEPEAAAPAAEDQPAAPASDFASRAAQLKKDSSAAYETAAKNSPSLPAPTEEEKEEPAAPAYRAFSFGRSAEPAAPAPAAPAPVAPRSVVPVPAPAPAKVEAPAPVKKEAPKKVEPAKPTDRRSRTHGFMPLWLAELLVLGSFVGVGLAATKYSSEAEGVLKAAGQKAKEAYDAAEKLVSSKTNASA